MSNLIFFLFNKWDKNNSVLHHLTNLYGWLTCCNEWYNGFTFIQYVFCSLSLRCALLLHFFFFFFCYNTSAKRFVQFGIHSLRKMGEKYENLLTCSGIKGNFFSPQHRECQNVGYFFPQHQECLKMGIFSLNTENTKMWGIFFPLNTNNVKMWEILPPPEHK